MIVCAHLYLCRTTSFNLTFSRQMNTTQKNIKLEYMTNSQLNNGLLTTRQRRA